MENTLTKSILQTLSYFDIFDYPLTREELFQFLWQPPLNLSYSDFILQLEKVMQTELVRKVESIGSYYFLAERSEIIAKRERKVLYTEEKIAIAKRGTNKLRYVPFVQALFVCNQLAVGVKKNSDIDVFIVVKRGHMWTTRALITTLLSFFLLRRTSGSIADMMCLSFYVTDDNLDLSSICIPAPDVYQAYWNAQLIPLYDPDDFFQKIQEKNTWVKHYLPHTFTKFDISNRARVSDTSFTLVIKKFAQWFLSYSLGSLIERHFRFLQLQKMKLLTKNPTEATNKSVVISDTMLKFHENDRKQYFKDEWEKRWKEKIV